MGTFTWPLASVIYAAGALLGGLAGEAWALIVGRIIMGVGGAIVFPTALAVTTNAFPSSKVQRAVGLVVAIGVVGGSVGPMVAGGLTDWFTWRAAVLISVPVAGLVVRFTRLGVAESRDETVPRSIDWPGVVLIAASIGLILLGIDLAGEIGWIEPQVLALVGAGIIGLALFVAVERRVRFPLLDPDLFRNRTFTAVSVGGALGTASSAIVVFMSMIYLQEVEGLTASRAAVVFLTFSVGGAIGALASGRLERYRPWVVMTVALVVGGIGVVGMGISSELAMFAAFGLVAGTGLGLSFAYVNVISQAAVPARQAGAASGTAITMNVIAGVVAVVIAASVYDTAIAEGGADEASVIRAIFVGAGILSVLCGLIFAILGRGSSVRLDVSREAAGSG